MLYQTYPATESGYSCAACGTTISRGDPMIECPDCAAVFCARCANNGTFHDHDCDALAEDVDWETL